MKTFEARMRVVHEEVWTVEAENEKQARNLFATCNDVVETDDSGGEVVDLEVMSVKEVEA